MAFALDPATVHSFLLTLEVLVQPTIALQAHYTILLPSPSSHLFTATAIRAPYLPPAYAQYYPLHTTPSPGAWSLGLVRAQHPLSPLPGTVPVQQLLLPHSTPYTTQHLSYPPPMHQVQIPACMPQHILPLHGYAGSHLDTRWRDGGFGGAL